jgi:hypothetical protein
LTRSWSDQLAGATNFVVLLVNLNKGSNPAEERVYLVFSEKKRSGFSTYLIELVSRPTPLIPFHPILSFVLALHPLINIYLPFLLLVFIMPPIFFLQHPCAITSFTP